MREKFKKLLSFFSFFNKEKEEDVKVSFKEKIYEFIASIKRLLRRNTPQKNPVKEKKKSFFLLRWFYIEDIKNFIQLIFQGKGFPDSLFSTQLRPIQHKIFLYILFFVFACAGGLYIAWEFFPKKEVIYTKSLTFKNPKYKIQGLRTNLLFKTKEVTSSNLKGGETSCIKGDLPTSLNLSFIGISLMQKKEKSSIALKVDGSQELSFFRIGEDIKDLAKIYNITPNSLVFKNLKTGVCEYLDFYKNSDNMPKLKVLTKAEASALSESEKKLIVNIGNTFKIKKSFLTEKLKNIQGILNDAYSTKIDNSDGSQSYKISNIAPASIYAYLGIQNNDIITTIDGKKIKSMTDILGFFSKIKTIKNIQLSIERNGRVEDLKYIIED